VIGDLRLDPDRHRVEKMGQEVHLTPKEFAMLRYLMEHAGRPISQLSTDFHMGPGVG
jgi:two-component system KDP operon response regulator KdpE